MRLEVRRGFGAFRPTRIFIGHWCSCDVLAVRVFGQTVVTICVAVLAVGMCCAT